MDGRHVNFQRGFTLIESMVAITILAIVVIGATAYRYAAALDCKKASVQASAGRAALTMLETWKGASDPCSFDPTSSEVLSDTNFTVASDSGPGNPSGYTSYGNYKISSDGCDFYGTLSWKTEKIFTHSYYTTKKYIVRAYNINMAYDDRGRQTSGVSDTNKSLMLTVFEYQ